MEELANELAAAAEQAAGHCRADVLAAQLVLAIKQKIAESDGLPVDVEHDPTGPCNIRFTLGLDDA